jgi:NAD(P) transhydrogenase subunit beta
MSRNALSSPANVAGYKAVLVAASEATIVIGANDVTNPAARNDPSSPIQGMPILNVDQSRSVIVLNRSMNSGFAGIDNPLFYADGTTMLFGDAKKSVIEVADELKALRPR